ncbi:MAG: AAA family ATPase, partial [Candidatus Aegiribacteria sp.]|nr:AAA family ATPase [Candidatus Aegiribacteria sp.]MBD3294370.1 AAA family ATPase [Candidatus Fermentibacteria bacterium]
MYLKRLEIVGFKSFADAFEMEFQKGISCIVGPNGCGKSNIADAIRWALGSQSPNELRADRMEDVIFSGAMDRKAQGMAEVILTFDNTGRDLDLDFDEVTVTRRLFRSGDSEYLLNGNRCRLMDITDLIVDKGLGSNGYWILEKNMTKTIIESSPSDRRFLFDEAAGIVKYKMQRHRAELKLNSVADDLERLDDIISEVENNVATLKKQVSAFRRWERAEKRITELRSLKQYRVLSELEGELRNLKKEMKSCETRRQKAEAAHSAASAKQARARVELDRAQAELDSRHEKCSSLDSTIGSRKGELAVAEERFRNLRSRIEDLQRERTAAKERISRFGSEAESLKLKQEQLKKSIEKARDELEEASRKTATTEELHANKSRELERARKDYEKLSGELQVLRKEYTDGLRTRERAGRDLESARERKKRLESAAGDVEENLGSIELQLQENEKLRNRLDSRKKILLESDSSVASEMETTRTRLHSLEMEKGLVKARIESLREASSGDDSGYTLSSVLPVREGMAIAVGAWL